ncbi:MAG: hypothetical protein E7559_03760 [Ruminococcaceae bacterium]|nr:hypothetical protein [Oscillospiraceae bacterium]
MSEIIINKNSISFRMRDEIILIEPYGPDTVRVRTARTRIYDEDWTLLPPLPAEATTFGDENKATLVNGSLTVELYPIWEGWQARFLRHGKEILRTRQEEDAIAKYRHTEGDHYRIRAVFEPCDDEHFYGLGQEQQPYFDRKGGAYALQHTNTKSTLPAVYSSRGYYFLWNNPAPGHVELAKNRTLWQADSALQADYIVAAADTPSDGMRRYCELTGFSPAMPQWTAGFWQCKLRYESQEDLLAVAREYKKRNIPLDVIVIDFFHWTEQGDWRFEPSLWPDPKAMCDELREMGIRPVVSVWPTINPKSINWKTMNDRNLIVRTEKGQYGMFEFHGQQAYVDTTNPEARDYLWNCIRENYYKYGIHNFWLDQSEPEVHPQQYDNLRYYLGNGGQMTMLYPYYYAKTFYDGLRSEGETDPVSLIRCAYPGIQKFGAVVWNGDIPSTWQALRESVVSGLSMAVCGVPWWTTDIGGFHSGDPQTDDFKELIVRWFQFGLFSPVMRAHGVRIKPEGQKDRHPGLLEPAGGDNELWSFGERNYPILRDLVVLRDKLKPYILRTAENTARTGEPIMRPMFFDFPDEEACWQLSDQYMFGSDILFAPIMQFGQTSRQVYLPKGRWVRTTDGSVHVGGCTVTCTAEIDQFIAFVREGAEVYSVFE